MNLYRKPYRWLLSCVVALAVFSTGIIASSAEESTTQISPGIISLPEASHELQIPVVNCLFNGDITKICPAPFYSSPIQLDLGSRQTLNLLRIYGSAPYRLSVFAADSWGTVEIRGLQNIDLSLQADQWNTFTVTKPVTTSVLWFRLDPIVGSTAPGLREIQLWVDKNPADTEPGNKPSESSGNDKTSQAVNNSSKSEKLIPGQSKKLQLDDDVVIEIGDKAVDEETTITCQKLEASQLPPLNTILNVTKDGKGLRCTLSNGKKFKEKIKLKIKYDKSRLQTDYQEDEIKGLYFDTESEKWIPLERADIDKVGQVVTSYTDHFTDFVNGIVTVPESPQSKLFNPNEIKDIKVADPASKINLIAPPQANNNTGGVHLSYPIEVPPGRLGNQPQLSIDYGSDGGNDWMGLGWNLSIPMITIDTRWGVPRYNTMLETENYLLNGQQLNPIVHRETLKPRTAEKEFQLRLEGQFFKVIRHGNHPANYWWEVIDKNGTRHSYGGAPENTLTDANGNVFKWMLREIKDTNGNTTHYQGERVTDVGLPAGTVPGQQLYIKTIKYTGYGSTEGPYQVKFLRSRDLGEARRIDTIISGRGGFKEVTADLLRKIEVTYNNEMVRSYELKYQSGASSFFKSLLASITQYGENGGTFYTHTFEYWSEACDSSKGNCKGFASSNNWNTGSDGVSAGLLGQGKASAISGIQNEGIGAHLYTGIGKCPEKKMSVGVKVGGNMSRSDGLLTLMDINGDTLPDKIFRQGGAIYYRANRSGPSGNPQFGPPRLVANLPSISKEKSKTFSFGAEAYMGVVAGVNVAKTFSQQPIYFIDVNSDGLVDLNYNGTVLFNHINANGDPFFSANNADTPYPIGLGILQAEQLTSDFSAVREENIDNFPLLDTVRRWVAPYDGQVAITGTVALIQDTSPDRQTYTTADGVRVAIQLGNSELWSTRIAATDYTPKTPIGINALSVKKGDAIYLRVQSIEDGSYDQVSWNPEIRYLNVSPTLDANKLDAYVYNANKDFTLAGYRKIAIPAPFAGKIHIEGELEKLDLTTDDVTLLLLKNDVVIYDQTIKWNALGNLTLAQDVSVAKEDRILVQIKTDSPIDLTQLRWNKPPRLFYTESSSPELPTVKDAQGNPIVAINLFAEYDLYPVSNLSKPLLPWVAPQSGQYTVQTLLALAQVDTTVNGTVTVTVKRLGEQLGKYPVNIVNGIVANGHFTFIASQNDKLYFEFSTREIDLAAKLSQIEVGVIAPNGSSYSSIPSEVHSAGRWEVIPQSYRNWTIFGYDGNRERANNPITLTPDDFNGNKLAVTTQQMQAQTDEIQQVAAQWQQATEQGQPIDPSTMPKMSLPQSYLQPFYPDLARQRWQSGDEEAWLQGDKVSSSRKGVDNIDIPLPQLFAGASAVPRSTCSNQLGFSLGVSLPPIPANVAAAMSNTDSCGLLDELDMNGDRFPDVVGKCGVQYTDMLGALGGSCQRVFSGDVRNSVGSGVNIGVGATFPAATPNSRGSMNSKGSANSHTLMASIGVSANISSSDSTAKRDLIDVNGDGLPDSVTQSGSGLMVALNIGYGFLPSEPWGDATINKSKDKGFTVGGTVGFNAGIYDFGGGVNLSRNESQPKATLLDMNTDGLLDKVSDNGTVSFNTGNGFAPSLAWPSNGMSENVNTTLGGGVYFTVAIPLGTLPICIIINPGADVNKGMARQEVSINDIDGDGYPDYLHSNNDGSVDVGLSPIGRTNLLKKVNLPIGGGYFAMDYVRTGNTYAQPHNQWAMSRLSIYDGHPGDGVDVQLTTFRYENGFYHRQEREFYGFQTVVAEDRDITQGDKLYRYVTRTFLNNSHYSKGLLQKEVLTNAEGKKYTEVENTYFLRDMATNAALTDLNHLTATVFPELQRTDKRFYEGQDTAGKFTSELFEYDRFGNVTRYTDANDIGNADDVDVKISYFQDLANYIVGKPKNVEVFGAGVPMRKREATFETGTGNLKQVRAYLPDAMVVTDLSHDRYGNVIAVAGPLNYKSQRFTLSYQYDTQVNTYPERIQDSFGYVSMQSYNLKQGAIESSTDINNNSILTSLDEFGRITMIKDPYAQEKGYPYTIRSEYHHDAAVPYAVTQHIDPYRNINDPIETVTFIDGLKRAIQVKKDGTVHKNPNATAQDQVIVSGHVDYDFVGRTETQYYPVVENLGQQGKFNPEIDTITPTRTEHDVLDRTTRITAPDNTVTTMAYGFGNDRDGHLQFLTRVTDAMGIPKETYRDINESITSVKEFNKQGSEIIWNSMAYDPLNQIISVWDDHRNQTTVIYDNLGRRTNINNPDTGLMEWKYDTASNVIQHITANARQGGQAINYEYDYTRLAKINYPIFPETNVTYEYGGPGAPFNRAGRVVKVFDQSGNQESFYGKLGETVKTIRTIASETQGNSVNSPEVYTTQYEFDSFARLQRLIYPDDEKLVNNYDSGGLLREIYGDKVSGAKNTNHYKYLNRLEYDKFSQRVYMEYANKVQHRYSYDERNRRLMNLQAGFTSAKHRPEVFQDLVYQYDLVGNILGQENRAATTSPDQMGGKTKYTYQYDDLYRLIHAEGTFDKQPDKVESFRFDMEYNTIHNIVRKNQVHEITQPSGTPLVQEFTTYDWQYAYGGPQPHAPTQIGPRSLTYDLNGNQAGFTEPPGVKRRIAERTIAWDASNRIQSVSDNGHTMRYKYDHGGERVMKMGPQGETVYVNQFFSIRNREVATKHIFAGATRIVSKLAKQESLIRKMDVSTVKVADAIMTLRTVDPRFVPQGEAEKRALKQPDNPGNSCTNNSQGKADPTHCQDNGTTVPTVPSTGTTTPSTPSSTTVTTPATPSTPTSATVTTPTTPSTPPSTTVTTPTTPSTTVTTPATPSTPPSTTVTTPTTPSTPIDTTVTTTPVNSGGSTSTQPSGGQNVGNSGNNQPPTSNAGGNKPVDTTSGNVSTAPISTPVKDNVPNGVGPSEKNDTYYHHPDHLGSSAFITDENAELFEHLEYFPFGETFVEEKSNTQRTPYLYTAKELDEETGLYYYGARYFDARTSVWQSTDPILNTYLNGKKSMGGVYNSFNLGLYSYGHLNPVKFIDPDGNEVSCGKGIDCSVLSKQTNSLLNSITANENATISSSTRSPERQANAMFVNIVGKGIASQKKLYGPSGDKVIDVYAKLKKEGKTEQQIKDAMKQKIIDVGPSNVSHHAADPSVLNVVDIDPSTIKDKKAFNNALQDAKKNGDISKFILPGGGEPVYHIEIPQPKISNDVTSKPSETSDVSGGASIFDNRDRSFLQVPDAPKWE